MDYAGGTSETAGIEHSQHLLRTTHLLLPCPFKRTGRTAGSHVNDVEHPTFSTSLFNLYCTGSNSSTSQRPDSLLKVLIVTCLCAAYACLSE